MCSRKQDRPLLVNCDLIQRLCAMQEDVNALRRIAKLRGLVNGSLRRKAWPILLGMPSPNTRPLPKRLKGPREGGTSRAGRDVDTIAMDVARCLHHTNGELHDQNRDVVRESLISLLASVVDAETVFYYQVCVLRSSFSLCCACLLYTSPSPRD